MWQRIEGRWLITAAHVTPRAQAFDRSVWRTRRRPALAGRVGGAARRLTVAVKDLFAIKGYRIGAGNPAFLDGARAETTTAPAVSDLLRGGASLRGIARTDEFAYSIAGDNVHYGTPPNGALPGALPGGSSSGPASAVATGQADVGLATDTAGSVRVPASYQGLWGLRTTHGLVPRQGLLPLAQSFDTIGWLTRDGETLQRVADWCLSYDGSPSTEHAVRRVGSPTCRGASPCRRRCAPPSNPRRSRRSTGCSSARAADAPPWHPSRSATSKTTSCRSARCRAPRRGATTATGSVRIRMPSAPAVAERFRAASEVTAEDEASARAALAPLRERIRALVADAVLILPTVPGPAPMRTSKGERVDAVRRETLRMTTPAAIGGLPSISIPLLTVPSALGPAPVGVCLIAPAGTDIALVRLARRLADAVGRRHPADARLRGRTARGAQPSPPGASRSEQGAP